ncbi:DnaJ domain-containing protein [Methylobacterium sp. WL12]|uniref:DnaJ domain-containing protein n=1 Tax=Methylobacterium sp. WL12 TaxID=2603890 RepID=UPI0011C8D3F8|nr:DnaJ domain-containing protein [Methylobacterium sp. WL12]TXM65239.1 DnaJ domain-containing protein [Methylobacterium sp. WL12]
MTYDEACCVLGVPRDATMEQLREAYFAKAKQHHPDHNGGSAEAAAAFRRVKEAYDTLLGRKTVATARSDQNGQDRSSGGKGGPDDATAVLDPVAFVRNFMANTGITILFNGTIRVGTGRTCGYGPDDVEAWLGREPVWDFQQLLDELMLEIKCEEIKLKAADIARAIRKIVHVDRQERANVVMRPIVWAQLDATQRIKAEAAWERLVSAAFAVEPALGVAVLKQFVWQVKRKQLELPVEHHLMPVIFSPVQGGGKTIFVRLFLSPLDELATDPVLLSDIADKRSGDVLRFPVGFVDDMERLELRHVGILKAFLTTDAVARRKLFTSLHVRIPQLMTLIGTANEPVAVLIPDPTGHRRFAELHFRNGAEAKGGEQAVWDAIAATDFVLLWRSVDGHGPAPILPHLASLAAVQEASAPPDALRDWLRALDLQSEAVLEILQRWGAGADDLRALFCVQSGVEISNTEFERRMAVLVGDPAVPFKMKRRVSAGVFYPRKPCVRATDSSAA